MAVVSGSLGRGPGTGGVLGCAGQGAGPAALALAAPPSARPGPGSAFGSLNVTPSVGPPGPPDSRRTDSPPPSPLPAHLRTRTLAHACTRARAPWASLSRSVVLCVALTPSNDLHRSCIYSIYCLLSISARSDGQRCKAERLTCSVHRGVPCTQDASGPRWPAVALALDLPPQRCQCPERSCTRSRGGGAEKRPPWVGGGAEPPWGAEPRAGCGGAQGSTRWACRCGATMASLVQGKASHPQALLPAVEFWGTDARPPD